MPAWLISLVSSVFKPIADGWGSTLRYKRGKAAKEAALENLKLLLENELERVILEEQIPERKGRKLIREFTKAWKEFNTDSIIKG